MTGSLIANAVSADAIEQWAWRLPFILGLLVGVVGYFLRRSLPATAVAPKAERSPLAETVRNHRPLLLWLAGLTVFGSVGFYLVFLYVVSWLQFADGKSRRMRSRSTR